jgi:drug/metabolite transporter, DME family
MPRLLILLSAVCFGTTGTAQALGAAGSSPITVGAARILIGALGLQCASRWGRRRAPITGRAPIAWPSTATAWLAAVGVAGYQVTFFLAVRITGVAAGTVVALGSAPVVTGALAWACRQGRPGARWATATGLAAAGLGVLALGGDRAGGNRVSATGLLLAVGAAGCYATYTLSVKRWLDQGCRPAEVMATIFTGGAVLLSPALILLPARWLATPRGALAALWLGVVPTAIAYALFARGLGRVSAAEASTLTLAEPLTAAALGVLLLGETPSAAVGAGAALLLAGLVVLARPAPAPPAPGAPGAPGAPPSAATLEAVTGTQAAP